jgi:hypothetical protein
MEITPTNIHEYYHIVQDQINKINTKKELDIKYSFKYIMTNLDYLMPTETYESSGCTVRYDRNNLEIKKRILSLIFISWTLMNLTNKVKEGHCLNINHQHGDQIHVNISTEENSIILFIKNALDLSMRV